MGAKRGSVGRTMRLKGNRLSSTWGYQVRTIRNIKRKIIIPKRGARIQLARIRLFIKVVRFVRVLRVIFLPFLK